MATVMNQEQLARGLGWFSIGLGLAEVAMPRRFARMIGVNGRPSLIRSVGVREIMSGVGILSNRKPTGWVTSRIAGDVMDLSLLALALRSNNARPARVKAATAAVAGVTALDVLCRQRPDNAGNPAVHLSISVNRPPEELYRFWREPQNLPRVMKNLESVQQTGERRWHWAAKGPAGTRIEWDSEITEDRPNQRLAWRTAEGAPVRNSGSVRFERLPAGHGTAVRIDLEYDAPGAAIGAKLAKLLGQAPEQQVWEALRSFKQIMETGEVAATVGQPSGHRPPSLLLKLESARHA